MDLIDLRLFLHVVEQGSITAGADRSHMTLASASARVRALEDALGTPLLVRERRGAQPTPAGQTLARHAQQVLAQVGQLHEAMAEHTQGPRAHLRLLANTSAATVHLPPLLARFLAAHPGYTLDMQERPSAPAPPSPMPCAGARPSWACCQTPPMWRGWNARRCGPTRWF